MKKKILFLFLLIHTESSNSVSIDLKWPLDLATVKSALYQLSMTEGSAIRVKNKNDLTLYKCKTKGLPNNLSPKDITTLEQAAEFTIKRAKDTIFTKLSDSIYNNIIEKAGQHSLYASNSSTTSSNHVVTSKFSLQSMDTPEMVIYTFDIPYLLFKTIANPCFNLGDNHQLESSEKIKSIAEGIARQHLSLPKDYSPESIE